MTRYSAIVYPRGFRVIVDADNDTAAYDTIDAYVRFDCKITLERPDGEIEDILDEGGFEICDLTEEE